MRLKRSSGNCAGICRLLFSTRAAEINVVTSDARRCSMESCNARLKAPCIAGSNASMNNTANSVAASIKRMRSERIKCNAR
ncbi:hypothetical protein D9M72_602400 [compost metagenome]